MINKGPKPKRTLPVCENPKCCTSTGMADELTHGWGKLNNMGYWQYPCPDKRHVVQDDEIHRELQKLK